MNSTEFTQDVLRTESRPDKLNFSLSGLGVLLLCGSQMARIMDTAKKTMFYGKPFDAQAFREQLANLIFTLDAAGQGAHTLADTSLNDRVVPEELEIFAPNLRIAHGAIGMFGEAGELLEAVVKQIETGELDLTNAGEELGDSFWYAAIIADEAKVSFEQVQETVIKKLKARYGDKFTNEAALNRDLKTERAVLEEGLGVTASL